MDRAIERAAGARRGGDQTPREESAGQEKRQPGPPKTVWREYFESIIVTVLMFLFFTTFIGRTVTVPTGSMQNTILIGDHFLINKFIYGPGPPLPFMPQREVRRGDIVVFKYPGDRDHPGQDARAGITPYRDYYIKRVVGLPGETIEVRGAQVLINGRVLPEHRLVAEPGAGRDAPLVVRGEAPTAAGDGDNTLAGDAAGAPHNAYYSPETLAAPPGSVVPDTNYFRYAVGGPVRVPDGHYFMMGDARDNSADSRVWGFVHRDLVVGRAMFVFWSYDNSAPSGGNPLTDFFKNTRWNRTGTMIK